MQNKNHIIFPFSLTFSLSLSFFLSISISHSLPSPLSIRFLSPSLSLSSHFTLFSLYMYISPCPLPISVSISPFSFPSSILAMIAIYFLLFNVMIQSIVKKKYKKNKGNGSRENWNMQVMHKDIFFFTSLSLFAFPSRPGWHRQGKYYDK